MRRDRESAHDHLAQTGIVERVMHRQHARQEPQEPCRRDATALSAPAVASVAPRSTFGATMATSFSVVGLDLGRHLLSGGPRRGDKRGEDQRNSRYIQAHCLTGARSSAG